MKTALSLLLCFLLGAGQLRFHKENLLWQERGTVPERPHWRNSLPARPAQPSRTGTSTGDAHADVRAPPVRYNVQWGGGIAGPGRHGISAFTCRRGRTSEKVLPYVGCSAWKYFGSLSRRQSALSLCQPIAVRYRYKFTNGKTGRITYFSCLREL
jgi:hypothetical protein